MTYRLVALVNEKGGSGKTTLAVNLAGALASSGLQVVLADADPQQSATRWLAQRQDAAQFPVVQVRMGRDAARFGADLAVASRRHDADVLLVDLPPGLPAAAEAALLLADLALVPVTPSPLDLWAAEKAVQLIADARKQRGGRQPVGALVPFRVIPGTVLGREMGAALADFALTVAPSVSQRVAFAESAIVGKTLPEYEPTNPAVDELRQLAAFVARRIRG